LKGLYALAFVFLSFAACAQTSDTPTMLSFDLDDYFGEITEVSALPQIATTEAITAKSGESAQETGGVVTSVDNNAVDAPVGAIEPSGGNASVQSPIWWDDRLSFEDVTEPSTVPAQIAPESLETVGENASVQSPVWWDDRLSFEDEAEPSTVPARTASESTLEAVGENSAGTDSVATAEAMDVPVGGIEPRRQTAAASAAPSEDNVLIGEAMGQSEGFPQAF